MGFKQWEKEGEGSALCPPSELPYLQAVSANYQWQSPDIHCQVMAVAVMSRFNILGTQLNLMGMGVFLKQH